MKIMMMVLLMMMMTMLLICNGCDDKCEMVNFLELFCSYTRKLMIILMMLMMMTVVVVVLIFTIFPPDLDAIYLTSIKCFQVTAVSLYLTNK